MRVRFLNRWPKVQQELEDESKTGNDVFFEGDSMRATYKTLPPHFVKFFTETLEWMLKVRRVVRDLSGITVTAVANVFPMLRDGFQLIGIVFEDT
jgi:hypothetical protein